MTIEFTLLQNLTEAIEAVRDSAAAATEAFKAAYSACVSEKASAKAAQTQAETRAAHARFEMQASLSEARAYITVQESK